MAKTKTAACFVAVLVFIFFLHQITLLRDASKWKKKSRQMLSNSQGDWDARITCDRSHKEFDICTMNCSTLLDQDSLTFFALGPHTLAQPNIQMKIHPYPHKYDKAAMSRVKEITLTSTPPISVCGVTHHSPALVFSAGGYTGNFYHEINENFIPLFITVNSLFPNQDVILVITDGMFWWFLKYAQLLSAFTPHHLIINTNNLTTTHCFPRVVIGLIKHGEMFIDPKLLPYPKTLFDFHAFFRNAYAKYDTPIFHHNIKGRPNFILVSRKDNRKGNWSRVILNEEEVIKVAKDIGFDVHVFEPSRYSMVEAYRLIHTSHIMLGVHGAGLTYSLFLGLGSVLAQVVPIGTEWPSKTCFEKPAKILRFEYIEYKIQENESSLVETYGANSLVIKDPFAFHQGNWSRFQIYLNKQNVKIDIIRFKSYLIEAYKKAKIFMDRNN